MSLSRQSITLVLTGNKKTEHHIHPKHKRETEETAIANKTNYTLVWYASYDLWPGNAADPILTALEPTQAHMGLLMTSITSAGLRFL